VLLGVAEFVAAEAETEAVINHLEMEGVLGKVQYDDRYRRDK
jgi:hypothetical protein